ncbi:MAG: serine acetyltransferase [Erysipelotrichaceae bacterium]|nr:serine acetyltransferase [Erysipelotrichaceae bacterium]
MNDMNKDELLKTIKDQRLTLHNPIDTGLIIEVLYLLFALAYPSIFNEKGLEDREMLDRIEKYLRQEMKKEKEGFKEDDLETYLNRLPSVIRLLNKDVEALFEGDPAAKSFEEVISTYPGFIAVMSYRFAHEFYLLRYYVIARIIAEFAHSKTGIDIHPGATIGESFCIDHGTGVVIGETAVVGDRVRLYQGVTLGTRSFLKDEKGKLVRGYKRHPSVGNDVVIYANASVLGGDTYIGDNTVIGSNVWLDRSVKENTKIKNVAGGI